MGHWRVHEKVKIIRSHDTQFLPYFNEVRKINDKKKRAAVWYRAMFGDLIFYI